MPRVCLLLALACAFVRGTQGQWPLGSTFYRTMSELNQSTVYHKISLNTQERKAYIKIDIARAQEGILFGEGRVFVNSDGGLGYLYNFTDGSMMLYSLSPGSPPYGYMFHSGHASDFYWPALFGYTGPLGPDFYQLMSKLKSGGQVQIQTEMARAHEGIPFGEGRVFVTSDGGMGYLYNRIDEAIKH
ncbi:hypothetical protein DPMN_135543 [Dreissena polymorpha]|uniref:Uncharacterized protein n=1 Tax=Dreissena polymorpha TaxID=45954 RepID=A0A9D4G235_DREPO|nr:hypothetical protein DPMN_135543 [Dreissena polymorpha]